MSLAFGFALPHWQAISGGAFSPASLFLGGTAGAWYDPSDLSTLFTTSAGTTQCAMPGLGSAVSVGLMLDKSQNGVGTNGAKRVNLLTYSEQFDNAGWTKTDATAANTSATTDPLGGTTAESLTENSATAIHRAFQEAALATANVTVTVGISLKANTRTKAVFGVGDNSDFRFYAAIDLSAGAITQSGVAVASAGASLVSASISSQGNGWYRVTLTGTVATGQTKYFVNVAISNSDTPGGLPSYLGNGTSGIYIWGADLRLASEANTQPTYQRIDANWYSTMAGNHAIAFNDTTARPELRARVNLLTYSEEINNSDWTKTNATITADAVANPLTGTINADALFETTTNGAHAATQSVTTQAARFKYSVYLQANGRVRFSIGGISGFGGNLGSGVFFDLSTGQYVSGAASGATPSITDAGGGWWLVSYEWTANAATGVLGIFLADSGTNTSYAGDVTKGIYIWGADLRPANIGANVPAYQRIADANTYDTSGFPLYLRFDGIDDSMYTPANLNLSGTDKVAVFAGVRKLSDVAAGIIAEFSTTFLDAGGWYLVNDISPGRYEYSGRGNRAGTTNDGATAPITGPDTSVLTAQQNINNNTPATIRRNGALAGSSANTTFGGGNFGTYPLFIGARNNSSLWLNGHLHSLIIAGSVVSASNISATEQWVAGKTGIVIP